MLPIDIPMNKIEDAREASSLSIEYFFMKKGTAQSSEKAETGRYISPETKPARSICLCLSISFRDLSNESLLPESSELCSLLGMTNRDKTKIKAPIIDRLIVVSIHPV
jgi:hypothetical protein